MDRMRIKISITSVDNAATIVRADTTQPKALSWRQVLVSLCGHVIDGRTQFLPSSGCHWFLSCHARLLKKNECKPTAIVVAKVMQHDIYAISMQ